jgi:16S rRNA (uracil1498-N3)-methyltransferase
MPAERYFISDEIPLNGLVYLEDAEFHHLSNVMRSRPGDEIEIVNGRGTLAKGIVKQLEKRRSVVVIEEVFIAQPPACSIVLAQAIPRLNRLDFIVEKGCELGMTELWLFPGERSERKELSSSQLERLNGVLIAALKQCGRLFLPKIVIKPSLSKWTEVSDPSFFGSLDAESPRLIDQLQSRDTLNNVLFCTGPEAGFTQNEENLLRGLGMIGVKLHHNILRTDTASIAALAIISHCACGRP